MTAVDLRDGESGEHLLTRFRQAVQRDGILREIKQRRHFIPKSERRRIAAAKAARRRRRAKRVPCVRLSFPPKQKRPYAGVFYCPL